ncbi:MAG: hypothetical protein WC549_02090 [Actinomycetota bacterium]
MRNDCLVDLEVVIKTLITTKGYTESEIFDCMFHILQTQSKVKQSELFDSIKRKPKKEAEVDPKAKQLAKLFIELLTKRKKPTKPIHVNFGSAELMKLYEIVKDWEKIEWAIRYSQDEQNCSDKYMPVVLGFKSLREKYYKLEAHQERNKNKAMNEAFNKNQNSYVKPIRTVVYYLNDKFCTYDETTSACPIKPNIDIDQFRLMSAEQKKKYFNILTKEEKEKAAEKTKAILAGLKQSLKASND